MFLCLLKRLGVSLVTATFVLGDSVFIALNPNKVPITWQLLLVWLILLTWLTCSMFQTISRTSLNEINKV